MKQKKKAKTREQRTRKNRKKYEEQKLQTEAFKFTEAQSVLSL